MFLLSKGKTTVVWPKAPDLIWARCVLGSSNWRLQNGGSLICLRKWNLSLVLIFWAWTSAEVLILSRNVGKILLSKVYLFAVIIHCNCSIFENAASHRVAPKIWSLKSRNPLGIKDSLALSCWDSDYLCRVNFNIITVTNIRCGSICPESECLDMILRGHK